MKIISGRCKMISFKGNQYWVNFFLPIFNSLLKMINYNNINLHISNNKNSNP